MHKLRLIWLGILIIPLLLIGETGWAQRTATNTVAPPRISQAVVEDQRATMRGNSRLATLATADYGVVPDGQQLQNMILLLQPSDEQQAALHTLMREQQDRSRRTTTSG